MQTVLISFFDHEDLLILRFEDNKEIKLPRNQADYDGYVMAYWVEGAVPLDLKIHNGHITLTETLPDGSFYSLNFQK